MGSLRLSIDTAESAYTIDNRLAPLQGDNQEAVIRMAEMLKAIAAGAMDGKVRINTGAVKATNLVTFASFVQNDTVTLNGVTLTGKDSPSGAAQFRTGVSDEDSANSLRTLVNASTTAKIKGVVIARRRATVTCASVIATDTLVINGVTFTVATTPTDGVPESVGVGIDDSRQAQLFLEAIQKTRKAGINQGLISITRALGVLTIDYYGSLVISSTGGTITVASATVVFDCLVPGTIGNLCTLAISAHGSVTGANFASGTEGTELLFDKNRAVA